jgi:putative N6-adenine-specific DNA methylase
MPLFNIPPALGKRIKRQVIGKSRPYFVVAPPGLETLCREELALYLPASIHAQTTPGGVSFVGRLPECYLANLHLRTASRILMRLAEFRAGTMRELTRKLAGIPWELFLFAGRIPKLHVTCRHSKLYHSEAVADRVMASFKASNATIPAFAPDSMSQQLFVRVKDNLLTLSLDSSGEHLHKRAIKTHRAFAPLRETLAAGILALANYHPAEPLMDPMCGAGTFSLEAAMRAKKVPAGYFRQFAFMGWPAFQPARFAHLKKQAGATIKILKDPLIFASDKNPQACQALLACLEQSTLADAVSVANKDIFDLTPGQLTPKKGLIILNPPYGIRLGTQKQSQDLIRNLIKKLRSDFRGWRLALIAPAWVEITAFSNARCYRLMHGGLHLLLTVAKIG